MVAAIRADEHIASTSASTSSGNGLPLDRRPSVLWRACGFFSAAAQLALVAVVLALIADWCNSGGAGSSAAANDSMFVLVCGASASAEDCPGSGDPYAVIGVDKGASTAEDQVAVTKAYRKLARRWHPDRKNGDSSTFMAIAAAYDVLSDPEKKEVYDSLGEGGLRRLRDGRFKIRKKIPAAFLPTGAKESQ
jgi:hypothetical protein